ncbi:MAG: hypothetical protein IIX68_07640 [Clostridia bacterium]|nr:hypothetical protein [Clostridia bacterium]
MLKRHIAVALAVVLLLGCFAGCQPAEKPAGNIPSSTTEDTTTTTKKPTTTFIESFQTAPDMNAPSAKKTTTTTKGGAYTAPKGKPTYVANKELTIYAYAGPRSGGYRWEVGNQIPDNDPIGGWNSFITEKDFQEYKDAGFTLLYPEYDAPFNSASTFKGSVLEKYMETADKVGLDVLAYSGHIVGWIGEGGSALSSSQKSHINEIINTLSKYESFVGITLRDEPRDPHYQMCKLISDYIHKQDSSLSTLTAMLPIYGVHMIGNGSLDAYLDYIRDYGAFDDRFCYDYYPLYNDPGRGNYLKSTWFQNLEIAAKETKKNDLELGVILQSAAFGKIGGQGTTNHARSIKTKADVGYQLYSALAYGAKTIGYFTYWQHRHDGHPSTSESYYDGMVMYPAGNGMESVKTDAYYAVKAANQEVKKFDHVLMNFEWQGTTAIRGWDEYRTLEKIDHYFPYELLDAEATEDAIVGHLTDKNGYNGFMAVNATEPSQGVTSSVTLTFRGANAAVAWINGKETNLTLKDGSYTFDLKAGEGVFVIPYNK